MRTTFKMQGSAVTLKEYDYQVQVYPGMQVMMKDKEYTVQQAVLFLEKDEITVFVTRDTAQRVGQE